MRCFSLLALLFLCACLEIEDLGPYKDQLIDDPLLGGAWEFMPAGKDDHAEGTAVFARQDNGYRVTLKEEDEIYENIKTLVLGNHKFLVSREDDAYQLLRYDVKGGQLTTYGIKQEEIVGKALQRRYKGKPHAPRVDTEYGVGLYVERLDDRVAGKLQEIADDQRFWEVTNRLRRTSH